MKIKYRNSFLKDIKKLRSRREKELIKSVIEKVKQATKPLDIKDIEKLTGHQNYYKIKIPPFRIGIYLDNDIIEFVRFGRRQDFYKYFPPK